MTICSAIASREVTSVNQLRTQLRLLSFKGAAASSGRPWEMFHSLAGDRHKHIHNHISHIQSSEQIQSHYTQGTLYITYHSTQSILLVVISHAVYTQSMAI